MQTFFAIYAKDIAIVSYDNRNMEHAWIGERLNDLPSKNKSGLAAWLGLDPARITELTKGSRRIQHNEVAQIAAYLEMDKRDVDLVITKVRERPNEGSVQIYNELLESGQIQAKPPGQFVSDQLEEMHLIDEMSQSGHNTSTKLDERSEAPEQPSLVPEIESLQKAARALPQVPNKVMPILGLAVGGENGWCYEMNGTINEYVEIPAELFNVQNPFGIYMVGESMEPRYYQGEILHIHPNRPVQLHDFVLVERHDGRAAVKHLVKRTSKEYTLRQYNPQKDFTMPVEEVHRMFVIVGNRLP